jgi:hypothetical protein
MKLFDTVAIVCDHSLHELATAIRAPLELMRLQVRLHYLVQYQQAINFFANEACQYNYLVICCHGTGNEEADLMIRVEVVEQKDGDPERDDGWEATVLALRPSNIPQLLHNFQGNILSLACGSGREPFAKAFLATGCRAYIAPDELYFSRDSAMLFTIGFFYHLRAEDRDFDRAKLGVAEAVLAQQFDPRFSMGTKAFRVYEREV